MESSNNKGYVSSYTIIKFFLRKLFEQNLIDTDTYVFAMNMAREEYGQKQKKRY